MEITNLDSPDDGAIECLAGLCECYDVFACRSGSDEVEPCTAADQALYI